MHHNKTKLEESLRRMQDVLQNIAETAEEKNKERCPYKTAALACTFAGGCLNQVREPCGIRCGGDHMLKRIGDE